MSTTQDLQNAAQRLARLLIRKHLRLALAESCTGGLVAAALTRIPGISDHFCGSAVVYRMETKAEWLGVSRALLDKHGPVSEQVAAAMAVGVLANTPEAHLAAAVTGHLGPDAPPEQDGLVFVSVAVRPTHPGKTRPTMTTHNFRLERETGSHSGKPLRDRRQISAAMLVLARACEVLEGT